MTEKPRFQIQMKGAGLAPETVRASDLAVLLTHLEGAIVETAKAQGIPLAHEPNEVLVSLVHIEHGSSSDLTIAVARPISPAVSIISQAVVERRFNAIPIKAQSHLYDISNQAVRMRLAYEFHSINGLHVASAVISYEFPVPKPSAVATASGQSTLWGYLNKVGGDKPSVVLRLRDGKLITVLVTREIVAEIQSQNLIYTDIGLVGVATWMVDDWSLESFRATGIANYRPDGVNPIETFRKLREASQGRWDEVDPVEYVNGLRSGGA